MRVDEALTVKKAECHELPGGLVLPGFLCQQKLELWFTQVNLFVISSISQISVAFSSSLAQNFTV